MKTMENMNLDDKNKKLPFEVPEGYFEGFEDKMMARFAQIEAEEKAEQQTVRPMKWRRWAAGVAAAAVIAVGLFAVLDMQRDVQQVGNDISAAANDAYYDELNDELGTEEIEEALAQIEFDE